MRLRSQNLSKRYGSREVVADVSLSITPGKILALLGPNGAGKSTTIKMLTGQARPTSGRIYVDDTEHAALPTQYRHAFGIMPQEIVLWDDLNVRENLEYSAALYKLPRAQAQARIDELITQLRLEPELKTLAKNLSGGYKRRLNLAISIIHAPEIIFLDEPSPGIDAQSRLLLSEYIQHLATVEGCGVVLTDHYLDEAEKLADYVVIIDAGRVIAEGTVGQLKAKYGNGNLLQVHLDPERCKELQTDPEQLITYFETEFEAPALHKDTVNVLVKNPAKSLQGALRVIERENLPVLNVNVKESSLEDIFLLLTGRGVRE